MYIIISEILKKNIDNNCQFFHQKFGVKSVHLYDNIFLILDELIYIYIHTYISQPERIETGEDGANVRTPRKFLKFSNIFSDRYLYTYTDLTYRVSQVGQFAYGVDGV